MMSRGILMPFRFGRTLWVHSLGLAIALLGWSAEALAEDASSILLKEGDLITFDKAGSLRPFLPEELWSNRQFFFYEGMKLEVGPSHRDYSPSAPYKAKSQEFLGKPKMGPGSSLEGFQAGQAFSMDQIDCKNDPDAGAKVMWSYATRWSGDGGSLSFHYSYWDRGERLPLFYQGHAKAVLLAHRVEPQFWEKEKQGHLFRKNEKRSSALGAEVEMPPEYRPTRSRSRGQMSPLCRGISC